MVQSLRNVRATTQARSRSRELGPDVSFGPYHGRPPAHFACSMPELGERAWRVWCCCGAHLDWYRPQHTEVWETCRCGREVLVEISLENNQTTCEATCEDRVARWTVSLN